MSNLKEQLKQADEYKEKISTISCLDNKILESIHNSSRINFIYSTNALEGNSLTVSEIKMILENNHALIEKDSKNHDAIINDSLAYDFMVSSAKQKELSITEADIRKLHQLSFQGKDISLAGNYRTKEILSSKNSYGSPAAQDVAHLMHHLVDQIESSKHSLHPIELASMIYKRFVDIHPFEYGNEKVARLLMNIILVNGGYVITSIPPTLCKEYTSALYPTRRLDSLDNFTSFICNRVIEAECEYLSHFSL